MQIELPIFNLQERPLPVKARGGQVCEAAPFQPVQPFDKIAY
jgi:hypothetical protein